MKNRHWREIVEIVGVVAVVVSLLILAAEVRQSNQIARVEAATSLLSSFNAIHAERASNPEFAKLFPKMENPDAHLITATDNSQMRGVANHYMNVWRNVQVAYENGLVTEDRLNNFQNGLAGILKDYPGLAPHIVELYVNQPKANERAVFAPIQDYIDAQAAEPPPE